MDAVKYLLVVLLLPLSLMAASPEDSVVKINSYYSSSSLQPRQGSGMVILWQGHKYVLTSDHVAYHSNRSFTHEIADTQGHTQKLEYFVSDSGRGLALLRFLADDPNFVPLNLDPQSGEAPSLQESITMIGFPADSDAVLTDKKGKLSDLKFSSELFVELPELMAVKGGYGEFGMSGGAAFSASGAYRGLLSHQIVAQGDNTVLLIPALVVREWLSAILSVDGELKSPSPISLVQDPIQQVSDFPSYRTGNLYLTYSEPYRGYSGSALFAMSTKDKNTDTIFAGDPGPFAGLVFKPGASFTFVGFRSKEVLGKYYGSAGSLTGLLRMAKDPQIEPLWTYEGIGGIVTNVRRARTYYSEFQRLAGELQRLQTPRLADYVESIAWFLEFTPSGDSVRDLIDEQSLGNWRFIKPKDLDYLLNDPSLQNEWKAVAAVSLEPRLRQKLTELRTIMDELTF